MTDGARVFYDTEFHEQGTKTAIQFISIGMVREFDEAQYYAISSAVSWWAIYKNEWLRNNVLTKLPGKVKHFGNGGGTFDPDESSGLYKPPQQIASEVAQFCYEAAAHAHVPKAELWAHYADYDHVVLSQLFGRMIDLPEHMPMYTRDFKQAADMLMPGYEFPSQDGEDEHNALADALVLHSRFKAMKSALVGSVVGSLVSL